jgi:hypothetical protein
LKKLGRQSPPLTATSVLMVAAFIASIAGMVVDPRSITGVSAWLKPAKFAISTAIFSTTIAWIYGYLTVMPGFTRSIGWILATSLVLEVGIVDAQALRGTTSHFNIATPLDAALFGIMGTAIGILWLATVGIFVALLRQKFANPAWGWSLRLGLLITIFGSATGGLMLRSTPEQAAQHQMHRDVDENGAHTVGAPDGGPGLAGVGWSTEHGDLRVPHFFGLHGVQVLPFLAWIILLRGRRPTALVFIAGASYFTFVLILAWQALRGESVIRPSAETLTLFGFWLVTTVAAFGISQVPAIWRHGFIRSEAHPRGPAARPSLPATYQKTNPRPWKPRAL